MCARGVLQVRRALQRLPLGPDESRSIAALEERAAALRAKAEELRAQTVPRPQPSQYPALQQELARFMLNLGSVQRIAALLQALQVWRLLLCFNRLFTLLKCTTLLQPALDLPGAALALTTSMSNVRRWHMTCRTFCFESLAAG